MRCSKQVRRRDAERGRVQGTKLDNRATGSEGKKKRSKKRHRHIIYAWVIYDKNQRKVASVLLHHEKGRRAKRTG